MCSLGKTLIVTPFFKPNIGGVETFAEDLAKALSRKYVVHVCTIKWTEPILWKGMNYLKSVKMMWGLYIPLIKMLRKYKYEKVYALGLMSTLLCIITGIKFSSVIFNLYDSKKHGWIAYLLKKSEYVFIEGKKGKDNLIALGVPECKIVSFQHWCDQNIFTWKERNNEKMRVLYIGRPIAEKGKHIIQECEKLTQGIEYEYIENVPFKELPKHYQMADVVVVPSLYDESFCRVVVEAASCGCALVVSNRGSLPEQVKGFGKVIEPTVENFRDILQKLNDCRKGLEDIKIVTLVHSRKYFSEKNADCFFL